MINELREIVEKEQNDKRNELLKIKHQIFDLYEKKIGLENELILLKENFINRIIKKNKIIEISNNISNITTELSDLLEVKSDEITKENIDKKIKDLDVERDKHNFQYRSTTLEDLGLDFKSACELLKRNGKDIALTKEDIEFFNNSFLYGQSRSIDIHNNQGNEIINPIDHLKSYVLVHKTNYFPQNGRIKTTYESNVNSKFTLDKVGSLKFRQMRNTIHFSVNGEVGSHSMGNWDNSKYAVLVPFTDMPISQLKCGQAVDTYIEGGLNIPESAVVLCPKEEFEKLKEVNPNLNILAYDGQNVTKYADVLVSMLGYRCENIGAWSWEKENEQEIYYDDLKKSQINVHSNYHFLSLEKFKENFQNSLSILFSVVKKISDENIQITKEEENQLLNKIYQRDITDLPSCKEEFMECFNPFFENFNELELINDDMFNRLIDNILVAEYHPNTVIDLFRYIADKYSEKLQSEKEQNNEKGISR